MSITAEDFKSFLEGHKDEIIGKFLVVNWRELNEWNSDIADKILEEPDEYLPEFRKATLNFVKEEATIRLKGIPTVVSLRQLGSKHLGKLILIRGIINRVIPIRPLVIEAAFECKKCNNIIRLEQDEYFMVAPYKCGAKIGKKSKCKSRRFRFLEDESSFIDVQELACQERPEDLPAGQLPRQATLELREDLINGARAGDIVEVVGILRTKPASPTSKKRKFATYLDVNYIEAFNKEITDMVITPEQEHEICSLAMNPNIYELIINSIAPSIYGYRHIKRAIMYLLFGGIKRVKKDITIRGEMNVLLVGDPATAKSQLLQVVANISPRAIYTSGRGTSAAGLTAAVSKVEGEVWALDAGALVLADKGVCCIDEIDKMNDNDRVAIHEAMEQHKVSINKAGINARLNARTAVLAASNPDYGRYDIYKTVAENIKKLPVTLLSRFDLIFIMKDRLDVEEDEKLSAHILGINSKPKEMIKRELLKRYIAYAKNLKPKMTRGAMKRLQKFYLEMRKAGGDNGESSPVAITPRQLESLIRMSEAHAKIKLKDKTEVVDAEAAIDIMQKSLSEVGINPENKKIDIDILMTGVAKTDRDRGKVVVNALRENGEMSKQEIIDEMMKYGATMDEAEKTFRRLISNSQLYNSDTTGKRFKRVGT